MSKTITPNFFPNFPIFPTLHAKLNAKMDFFAKTKSAELILD